MGKHLLKSPATMGQASNKTQGSPSTFKGSPSTFKGSSGKNQDVSGLDITGVSCFTHNLYGEIIDFKTEHQYPSSTCRVKTGLGAILLMI